MYRLVSFFAFAKKKKGKNTDQKQKNRCWGADAAEKGVSFLQGQLFSEL